MNKIVFISILSLLATGCGTLGGVVMTDNDLASKMARQFHTTPDQIIISNRSSTANEIKYSATINGRTFDCQIVFVGGANSCYEKYEGK